MDSLYDLLAGKDFDQPPEIEAIKQFVRERYAKEVGVAIRDRDIVVSVPGASLAGKLRFDLPKLKEAVKTDKKIVLRITH
jgi:hypothetical protein